MRDSIWVKRKQKKYIAEFVDLDVKHFRPFVSCVDQICENHWLQSSYVSSTAPIWKCKCNFLKAYGRNFFPSYVHFFFSSTKAPQNVAILERLLFHYRVIHLIVLPQLQIKTVSPIPSLTISYGIWKCPVESSSKEPDSLSSPPCKKLTREI